MINWGFVNGKSQTSYPWDSWWNDYLTFPNWVWFHDIFRTDGTPYMLEEVNVIRRVKCPTGWYKSSSKNKCYKVFNMTMDWTNAEVMCRNNGGFVVSIDDAFENTDVTSKLYKFYNLVLKMWEGMKRWIEWWKDDIPYFL